MDKKFQERFDKVIAANSRKKRRQRIVAVLCVVVAVVTTWVLVNPASTQGTEAYCGYEEHAEHTKDCYARALVCGLSEGEGHKHTAECVSEVTELICGSEVTEGHRHTEECFDETGELICEKEECEPHAHTEECYEIATVYTCGLEVTGGHKHTDACYADDKELICTLPLHVHTLQCYSNPKADVENAEVWNSLFANIELSGDPSEDIVKIAKTQIGYSESEENYEVLSDGTTMYGYTRYGAWYGAPYSDWCAMFCSFCLHYAGIEASKVPYEASCNRWVQKLSAKDLFRASGSYIPAPGDLIFFDRDSDGSADHVGFVSGVDGKKLDADMRIKTIEGNMSDKVITASYSATDNVIHGYGAVAGGKNELCLKTIRSAPAEDGAVAVISGFVPEGAEAFIEVVKLSDEELRDYLGKEKGVEKQSYSAYDIKIMVDGEEWQPEEDNGVSVSVQKTDIALEEDERLVITHIDSDTHDVSQVEGSIDENGDIVFGAGGFSVYVFTVEFTYDGLTVSINGHESILLSDLFALLHIEQGASDAVSVTFTDDTLIAVEPVYAERGKTVTDWRLVSLAPFDTEEQLTITFPGENVLTLIVTDAALPASGDGWNITEDGVLHITGDLGKPWSGNARAPWNDYRANITKVVAEPGAKTSTCYYMFFGCTLLTEVDLTNLDITGATTAKNMFNGCTSLTDVDLSSLDTSAVTTMETLFSGCAALESVDMSGLDAHSVNNITGIFNNCKKLTDINMSGIDLSALATVTSTAFANTASLADDGLTIDLHDAVIKSVKEIFLDQKKLTSVDLSGATVSGSCNSMFKGCTALTSVDLSGAAVSGSCEAMFSGCAALTSVDLTDTDLSQVTSLVSMFNACTALESMDLSGQNFGAATKMNSMFSGCAALTEVNLSDVDAHSVKDISNIFSNCKTLTDINMSGIDLSALTTNTTPFASTASEADAGLTIDLHDAVIKLVANLFKGQTKLTSVDLSGATVSGSCEAMFRDCTALTSVDLTDADLSQVTSLATLFYGCTALESMDLSGQNFAAATALNSMFNGCKALTEVDLSGMQAPKAATVAYMFKNCYSMEHINMSGVSLPKAATLTDTFLDTGKNAENGFSIDLSHSELNTGVSLFGSNLYLREADFSGAKLPADCTSMFSGCKSLEKIDFTGADTSAVTTMKTMFNNIGLTAANEVALTVSSDFYNGTAKKDANFCKYWYWTDENGLVIKAFDELSNIPEGKTVTLYPAAEIRFRTNGGQFSDGTAGKIVYLRLAKLGERLSEYTVIKEGYQFMGWDETDGNSSTRLPEDVSIIPTAATLKKVLYAEWQESDAACTEKLFTVSIESSNAIIPNTKFGFDVTCRESTGAVLRSPTAEKIITVKTDKEPFPVPVHFTAEGIYHFDIQAPAVAGYMLLSPPTASVTVTVTEDPETGKMIAVPESLPDFEYLYVGEKKTSSVESFDISGAKRTAYLTEADKDDAYQYNCQITSEDDGTLIKSAEWTDKAEGEGKITIVPQPVNESEEPVALYMFTNCTAHTLTKATVKKNILYLVNFYSNLDVICGCCPADAAPETQTTKLELSLSERDGDEVNEAKVDAFLANITFASSQHWGAMWFYNYMEQYFLTHTPTAIYLSFDGSRSFNKSAKNTTFGQLNPDTTAKLAAYQNAGQYFLMTCPASQKYETLDQLSDMETKMLMMTLVNPAWVISPEFDPAELTSTFKWATHLPVVYEDGTPVKRYTQPFDSYSFDKVESIDQTITDVIDPSLEFDENDVTVKRNDGTVLTQGTDYTLTLHKTDAGTELTVVAPDGRANEYYIIEIRVHTTEKYFRTADDAFRNTNIGNANAQLITTYVDSVSGEVTKVVNADLSVASPKLYKVRVIPVQKLTVEKVLERSTSDEAFSFTASLTNDTEDVQFVESYHYKVYTGEDTVVSGGLAFTSSKTDTRVFNFTLHGGERIVIFGIAQGFSYTVRENDTDTGLYTVFTDGIAGNSTAGVLDDDRTVVFTNRGVGPSEGLELTLRQDELGTENGVYPFPFSITVTDENGDPVDMRTAELPEECTVDPEHPNVITVTLKDNEFVVIPDIPSGSDVLITETSHPGYTTKVTETSDGSTLENGDTYTVVKMTSNKDLTVCNTPSLPIPRTGGMGAGPLYIFGALLLSAAVIYVFTLRRLKERRFG